MNDAAIHMRELRDGWKSLGFQPLTLYIHDDEVEEFRALAYEKTGRRLLVALANATPDQLHHIAERKIMPQPELAEVAELRKKLFEAAPKTRARFDKFYEEWMDYLVLHKRVTTLDIPGVEALLQSSAELYARSFIINGSWTQCKLWYRDL